MLTGANAFRVTRLHAMFFLVGIRLKMLILMWGQPRRIANVSLGPFQSFHNYVHPCMSFICNCFQSLMSHDE